MDAIWGFAFKWSQTNWNSRSCAALMIRLMSFCRLLVEGRFWPEDMYFLHSDTFWPQFWTPGRGRGGEAHILTAFVSGTRADFLRQLEVDLVEFALGELDRIFGGRVASEHFEDAYVADWTTEPFVRGLYSFPLAHTEPRHREALAAPLGGKLFFA